LCPVGREHSALHDRFPMPYYKEMALTGARISSERAYQIGFLNAVSDNPKGAAMELAKKIASTGPQAAETTKLMLASAMGEDVGASIEAIASTAEKAEGVTSFFEKRKPDFGSYQYCQDSERNSIGCKEYLR